MNLTAIDNVTADLTKLAGATQAVEGMAAQAPAPVTGAQKLQAALLVAAQIPNPTVQATAGLLSALTEVWNLFGVFTHNSTPPAPQQ